MSDGDFNERWNVSHQVAKPDNPCCDGGPYHEEVRLGRGGSEDQEWRQRERRVAGLTGQEERRDVRDSCLHFLTRSLYGRLTKSAGYVRGL